MERADPGTADLTDVASEGRAPRRLLAPLALLVVLALLLTVVVLQVLDARASTRSGNARLTALQAARQQAVNLTSINYQTADRDLARIIAAATGTMRTQFEAQKGQFPAVLRQDKSVSTGTVLAAGVASQRGNTVEALVAVDATVSTAQSASSGVVKHYRMDMRLVKVSGRWLVSQVAFAGLPQ